MPARIIDSTIAGPAYCAAAWPVSTKMPVPMMAPMPSVTRLIGPSTRFSECSPVAAASAFSCSIDFVRSRCELIQPPGRADASRL